MDKIFIQIASYRDPELLPTIRNCIENSDNPENLVFAICWQKDEKETLGEYINDPRFKLICIHYSQAKGACWARNKLQQLYDNEEYTLQLDSHHRFIKGWDTVLKQMYANLCEKGYKPLITTYAPSYNPEKDPEERVNIPWKIDFRQITVDKQILFIPSNMIGFEKLEEPIAATFYSAHFAFTSGAFVKEVPHDPELYFTGEEMNITIRAFTHGYDLFHPHIVIIWHEYTRKNRQKHWDDDTEWWKKDLHSKKHYIDFFKNLRFTNRDNDYKYGLGNERTLEEYKSYANLDLLKIAKDET